MAPMIVISSIASVRRPVTPRNRFACPKDIVTVLNSSKERNPGQMQSYTLE
jgi:hypothetical protein